MQVHNTEVALGTSWQTTSADIVRAAQTQGIELRQVRPREPLSVRAPFIAWYTEGHFVVVEKVSKTAVLVRDNTNKSSKVHLSRENFLSKYGGVIIVIDD